MKSLVLGVMSRLCARIIGKAICPQKPCYRRSFSNAGHHGTAVRCDEIIDAAVVQAGNYWLGISLLVVRCKEYQLICPCQWQQLADTVAKVENRTTLKISRRLIFGLLCCCVAFQRPYAGP